MAADRRFLLEQTNVLLAHMGEFVRAHLVLLSTRQAQALGRLQMAVMQNSMAAQHERLSHDDALRRLETLQSQFEQQFAQLYTHYLPAIAPWPTLPAGPLTLTFLRLKTNILQTLQTMTLAEARARDVWGQAARTQLCTSLLSSRLTLAFVYDATRLLVVAAVSGDYCQPPLMRAQLTPLVEAMRRIDADLAYLFEQHQILPPQCVRRQSRPPSALAPVTLDAQLAAFQEALMVLSDRTQGQQDPMGFWAMVCDSFQRLLYACRLEQNAGECTDALQQTLSASTAQLRHLLTWFDAPDAPRPQAAPSA